MKLQVIIAMVACCTFGCASLPEQKQPRLVDASSSGAPLLLVADPQIHNVYGMELKQMLGISDVVSKVAIRPPELNLLAPQVLTHLVSKAQENVTPKAIVMLGDATNIACSGEYIRFAAALKAARVDGVPLLLAHGNHDSYLMGTVNSYIPTDNMPDWPPVGMEQAEEPVDISWWGESTEISAKHRRNWRDGCFQPSETSNRNSSPMNKSRWMAKYLSALKTDGLINTAADYPSDKGTGEGVALAYSAKQGSLLSKFGFNATGVWFPPKFGDQPSSSDTDLMRVSKSFIVQSVDFDDSRLVIIDTSVCESARGGLLNFPMTNAGTHACIGDEQFDHIVKHVRTTSRDRRLVIAGHFPLKDLNRNERDRLISIASKYNGWVYLSAHSHTPVSETEWTGGWELNVGSTTDWPMEINSVWLSDNNSAPGVLTTVNQVPESFHYDEPVALMKSEVCRHLPSAKFLAEMHVAEIDNSYSSPIDKSCTVDSAVDWNAKGNELFGYIQQINVRFKSDPAYRHLVLRLVGAASRSEGAKSDLAELIP